MPPHHPQPQQPQTAGGAEEPLSKAQRHTTFAAVIFLVIFVVAGTISLYSAYLLWRGEDAGPVLASLPAGCDGLWMVDEPQQAAAALRQLGSRSGRADKLELWAATLQRAAQVPGVDPKQSWGFCRRGGQWYAAIAVASEDPAAGALAGQQAWEALRGMGLLGQPALRWQADGARWLGRDTGGQVRAAVRASGGVAQITWAHQTLGEVPGHGLAADPSAAAAPESPLDAAATLDALQAEVAQKPLQKDEAAREALERVGGGQMRVVLRGPPLGAVLQPWLAAQGQGAWQEGLAWVQWGGAALRVETGRVKLHGQLGGGQRWAVWLKERFDAEGEFDAGAVVPAAAARAGVLRVARQSWPWLAGLDPAVAPLSQLFADPAGWHKRLTGHVAWFGDGPCLTAVARLRPLAAQPPFAAVGTPPGCPQSQIKRLGDLVVVGSAEGIAAAEKVAADPSLSASSADKDRQRLQRDTQGFWLQGAQGWPGWPAGPLQAEWIWLDTGLIAAVDLGPAVAP